MAHIVSVIGHTLRDMLYIRRWSESIGLSEAVETAFSLAATHFPIDFPSLRLDRDPETGSAWVVIDVSSGSVSDAVNAERAYAAELIRLVPWPGRDSISLAVHVAD